MALLDVTREIKLDHDNIRDLFERFKTETNLEAKAVLASTLIREMATHGDAEEATVYNEFSSFGLGKSESHNREEHAEIKRLISEADAARASGDYAVVLTRAVTTFLTHAEEEETDQFPKIQAALSPEGSNKLAREFIRARSQDAQSGNVASDKLIQSLQGREFAPVKFSHIQV